MRHPLSMSRLGVMVALGLYGAVAVPNLSRIATLVGPPARAARVVRELPEARIVFTSPSGHALPRVPVPPIPPSHEARTQPPSDEHVWLHGQLWWNGRGYVWLGGSWAIPPSRDARWIPGRWVLLGERWQIVPGHWLDESTLEPAPADPIEVGVTAIGTLSAAGRQHDFAVHLRTHQSVSAIATAEPVRDERSHFDWEVQLLHRGQPLARGDEGAGSGERELVWTVSEDDLYVFRVSARGEYRSLPYRFTIYPAGLARAAQ